MAIQPNKQLDFSVLSSSYDLLGDLFCQGYLRKSQNYFLADFPKVSDVLIIGGGTGRFLIDLLKNVEVESVTYVDISAGMIAKSQKKLSRSGFERPVNFICGSLEDIPDQKFDLICTHFFLDCFSYQELGEVFNALKCRLSTSGKWHFTDFVINDDSLIRSLYFKLLYLFFRITCGLRVKSPGNFKELFLENGFKEEKEKHFYGKLMRTAVYSF